MWAGGARGPPPGGGGGDGCLGFEVVRRHSVDLKRHVAQWMADDTTAGRCSKGAAATGLVLLVLPTVRYSQGALRVLLTVSHAGAWGGGRKGAHHAHPLGTAELAAGRKVVLPGCHPRRAVISKPGAAVGLAPHAQEGTAEPRGFSDGGLYSALSHAHCIGASMVV